MREFVDYRENELNEMHRVMRERRDLIEKWRKYLSDHGEEPMSEDNNDLLLAFTMNLEKFTKILLEKMPEESCDAYVAEQKGQILKGLIKSIQYSGERICISELKLKYANLGMLSINNVEFRSMCFEHVKFGYAEMNSVVFHDCNLKSTKLTAKSSFGLCDVDDDHSLNNNQAVVSFHNCDLRFSEISELLSKYALDYGRNVISFYRCDLRGAKLYFSAKSSFCFDKYCVSNEETVCFKITEVDGKKWLNRIDEPLRILDDYGVELD